MSIEIEFENIGKFIQRNNIALILFCTFALISSIEIASFNKNHQIAESIKTRIITNRSSVFSHITNAIKHGSHDRNSLWYRRYQEEDAENLINHELTVKMLAQWFDKFWQQEKNEPAAIELQQVFFLLSSIKYELPKVLEITGNDTETIESALNSLDSYLSKKKIKNIKLPVLGTEISVSMLTTIVPLVQCIILTIVSVYLLLAVKLMKSINNASDLLSNTILYLTDYASDSRLVSIFKLSRLIPSLLMIGVIYSFELLSLSYWQMYLTFLTVGFHMVASVMLDRKILAIINNEKLKEELIIR